MEISDENDIESNSTSKNTPPKRKTLEEIKELLQSREESSVSFVIIGESSLLDCVFILRPRRRRQKYVDGEAFVRA